MTERSKRSVGVARVFTQQPDRLAAAWRRVRCLGASQVHPPNSLLDGLVESFIREVGHSLAGLESSPWSRTRAVLRLSPERGARGLSSGYYPSDRSDVTGFASVTACLA